MSEPTITKAQLDELLKPLFSLANIHKNEPEVSPTRFHVPLTRTTSVEVKFHGPVGIDEYDALLAHIAFYKLLVPQDGEPKISQEQGAYIEQLKAITDKIWQARPSEPAA